MKKTIEYNDIKYRFIKIKYKSSNDYKIIQGKCFHNPLKPNLEGSSCLIVQNLGIIIREKKLINNSFYNDYYYMSYFPIQNIEEIFVIELDKYSPVLLAWVGKNKRLPFDILLHINTYLKNSINEIIVNDLNYYKSV